MIEILNNLDTELFLYLNNLGTESFDRFWLIVTNKFSSIPIYLLALILVYRHHGIKGALIILVTVILMITTTDQLSNLFKDGLQRARPCKVEDFQGVMRMIAIRCGKYGFFSAHAATSVAISVFLSKLLRHNYNITPYLLLVWCVLVSYSRVYLGVHYPGDILFGSFIGIFVGIGYFKLLCYVYLKVMKNQVVSSKLVKVNPQSS